LVLVLNEFRESISGSFEKRCVKAKKAKLTKTEALKLESERASLDQIRRLRALPMHKRTHILRFRRPGGGSHL
jgi:hypothetical protein